MARHKSKDGKHFTGLRRCAKMNGAGPAVKAGGGRGVLAEFVAQAARSRHGDAAKRKAAKERGAILTSLSPAGPAGAEEERKAARSTEARVLDAFRKHLLRSGLSQKVVERDAAAVSAFAEDYLLQRPHPRSLRDFGPDDVRGFIAHVEAAGERRKETLLGLKRFLRFLRDTERMDYEAAEEALGVLKGKG